jgi:hypothetical protein
MKDEEIIKELEGAIEHAKKTRDYYQSKVAECDELIAMNTRLIEVLKENSYDRQST